MAKKQTVIFAVLWVCIIFVLQFSMMRFKSKNRFPSFLSGYNSMSVYGAKYSSSEMSELPIGEGEIKGRILVDDIGLQGVELRVLLNQRFWSTVGVSDVNGFFLISVPCGDYSVNGIAVRTPDPFTLVRLGYKYQSVVDNSFYGQQLRVHPKATLSNIIISEKRGEKSVGVSEQTNKRKNPNGNRDRSF